MASTSGTSVDDELNKLKKEIEEKNKRITELEGKDIKNEFSRPKSDLNIQSKTPDYSSDFSKANLYEHLKVEAKGDGESVKYSLLNKDGSKFNLNEIGSKLLESNQTKSVITNCLESYKFNTCVKLIKSQDIKLVNYIPYSSLTEAVKGMNVYKIYNYLKDLGFETKLSKDPYPSPPNSNLTVRLCESVDEYLNRYMNASNSTIERVLKEIAGNASTSTGTLPSNNTTNSNTSQDQQQQGGKLNNNVEEFKQLITAIKGSIEMRKLLSVFVAYVNCFPNLFDPSYQYPNNRSSDLPSGKYVQNVKIYTYEDLRKYISKTVDNNDNTGNKNLVPTYKRLINSDQFLNKVQSIGQLNASLLPTQYFPNHFGMMLPINGGKSLESQGYIMSGGSHPFILYREQKSNNSDLETNSKNYPGKMSSVLTVLFDNIQRNIHSTTQGKVSLKNETTDKIKNIIGKVSSAEDEAIKSLTHYMDMFAVIKNTRGTINPLELPETEQKRVIDAYKNYSENTNKAIKGTNKVLSTLDAILKAIENFGTTSSNTNNNTDNLLPKFT